MTTIDLHATTNGGVIHLDRVIFIPEPVAPLAPSSTTAAIGGGEDFATAEEFATSSGYEERFALVGEMPFGYGVRQPIHVRVTFEVGEYVAEQRDLDLTAFGDGPIEAVFNLRARIIEHIQRLEELGAHLSPKLKQQRHLLREWLTAPSA